MKQIYHKDEQIVLGARVKISSWTLSLCCSLHLWETTKSPLVWIPQGSKMEWYLGIFVDFWSFESRTLETTTHLPFRWCTDPFNQVLVTFIFFLDFECCSTTSESNQKKEFIPYLSTHHPPACYVANAHGANKIPALPHHWKRSSFQESSHIRWNCKGKHIWNQWHQLENRGKEVLYLLKLTCALHLVWTLPNLVKVTPQKMIA